MRFGDKDVHQPGPIDPHMLGASRLHNLPELCFLLPADLPSAKAFRSVMFRHRPDKLEVALLIFPLGGPRLDFLPIVGQQSRYSRLQILTVTGCTIYLPLNQCLVVRMNPFSIASKRQGLVPRSYPKFESLFLAKQSRPDVALQTP